MASPRTTLQLECFGLTDTGRVRAKNEDQFAVVEIREWLAVRQSTIEDEAWLRRVAGFDAHLLAVADGLGGAPAGEVASRLAIQALVEMIVRPQLSAGDLPMWLRRVFLECQKRIETDAAIHPDRHGMGTTLTFAFVSDLRAIVGHAGDSRCYRLRGGALKQLTRDHTVVGHVLWNCLGGANPELQPDIRDEILEAGDTLLLCTDGLTLELDDEVIASHLRESATSEDACRALVDAAMQAGGRDNVTVVVARFT